MSKLLIVGAKGFAKELLEAVVQGDPEAEVKFYDDVSGDLPERLFEKFEIIRTAEAAADYFEAVDRSFALGIGAPQTRERLFEKFVAIGGRPRTVISPFAKIGRFANNIG